MENDLQEYVKNKDLLRNLKEKQIDYQQTLDNALQEQRVKNEQLIGINLEIQKFKEKLEDILKNDDADDGNEMGTHVLMTECRNVIAKFISDIPRDKHVPKSLLFKIEYMKNTYTWKIEDESMTFEKLKKETRNQFGRSEREFYFADEQNHLFLDELNVKKALFPLSSALVSGYIPTIKVIDTKNQMINKIISSASKPEEDIKKNDNAKKEPFLVQVKNYINNNFLTYLKILVFSLFLAFWITSNFEFRYSEEYRDMIKPFQTNDYKVKVNHKDFLNHIKSYFGEFFQYPTEEEIKKGFLYIFNNLNAFNQVNRVVYNARIIQTRYNRVKCWLERFPGVNLNSKNCTVHGDPKTSDWTNGNKTYIYNADKYFETITGKNYVYDNSGYYEDIPLTQPVNFYDTINNLIKSNWVDSDTRSIILEVNFYNINHDLFLTVKYLYEDMYPYFEYITTGFGLTDFTPYFNIKLIISLIFSSISIILMIFSLRDPNYKPEKKENKFNANLSCCQIIAKLLNSYYKDLKKKYRKPDLFESITFANFGLYYIFVILQYSFYSMLSSFDIKVGEFQHFSNYRYASELTVNLNCVTILLFLFCAISHISKVSSEMKTIEDSLKTYIWSILPFTFTFMICFIILSLFISYFMTGDYILRYYGDYGFMFLKMIQFFMRGSIDSTDQDTSIDPYYSGMVTKDNVSFADSYGSFTSIISKIGMPGYFVFSIIFYFVSNFIIKVAHTGFFLITYRNNYQDALSNKEKDRRKEDLNRDNLFVNS